MTTRRMLFLFAALASTDHAFADGNPPGSRLLGPFICTTCTPNGQLGYAPPGGEAASFLAQYVDAMSRTDAPIGRGDQVKVCNAIQCVTYKLTDSDNWNGTPPEPRVIGSGGGDSGGGPGSNPTNGGIGGGTGGGGGSRTTCGYVNGVRSTCIVG